MKWWGWGDEGVAFTHEDKPALGAVHRSECSASTSTAARPAPIAFEELDDPRAEADRRAARRARGGRRREHVSDDALDRVVHARGKSLRDLVRQRRGDLGRAPRRRRPSRPTRTRSPRSCAAALDADAVVIPFGGGTSISGSLEAPRGRDAHGDLGRPRAAWTGCSRSTTTSRPGPRAGRRLRPATSRSSSTRAGWTFGHFPDSFTHSTLGGWIATRSSGMQSDSYGDIADLTRGLRVVTPAGVLVTRPVPTHVDRPERARDGARQRGPARDHHRGDRAGPPRAGRAQDPRLPVPRLGRRRSPRCATSRPARRRRR